MYLIRFLSLRWLVAATLATVLTGCASAPAIRDDYLPVPPETFTAAGEVETPLAWWQALGDSALARLIERGLKENFSLRSAWARLRQAQAVAGREGAALLPGADAQISTTRQRSSDGDWSAQRDASVSAGYEVDLWGRIRATANAAELDALASAADLQSAGITVSAAIADAWYQLVEQRAQVTLLEQQNTTNRQLLRLVELRFRSGLAAASDVHRQRQLSEQTAGDLALERSRLAVFRHELAVLLGTTPARVNLPEDWKFPALPPLPRTGVPAMLVQRRPDLRSAMWRLEAADARAAAAVAAQYPQLNLTAAMSSSSGTGTLFTDWLSNITAQLVGPVFDGGRRRAEATRTAAVVEERLNDYGQSLLEAVAEVENALVREAGQRLFLERLQAQLREAGQVVERERLRYFQGDSDYLSVLDAIRNQQQLERQLITARRQLIVERISLLRALAGGWEMAPPESAFEPNAAAGDRKWKTADDRKIR